MRYIVLLWVFLFTLVITSTADANENVYELKFGGFSHHFGAPSYAKHNEKHNLVGFGVNNYEIMFMKNSFHNDSIVIAHNLPYNISENVRFGLRFGAASGYDIGGVYNIGGIAPFIQPNVTFLYESFGVELGYMPQISRDTPYGVATLTFNWRI